MRKAILLLLFSYLSVSTSFARKGDEQAVVQAVEAFRKALIDPDSNTLRQLVSDRLSYGHSSGVVQDKAALIDALMSGRSDFVSIDLSDQTISVTGDVAIVRHKLFAVTNDGGHPGTTKLSILLVLKKSHHKWILLARQAVKQQ